MRTLSRPVQTLLVDYTAEISEKERQLAIENLVNHWLPKGMFSLGTEPDTIVYNGGMDDWLGKEWLPKIRQAAQNLSTYNVFKSLNLYRMERLLDNALDIGTLFYISSDNYQSYAERSTAFMEYINEYPEGTFSTSAGCLTIIGNHKIYLQYETLDNNIKGTKPS